MVASEQRRHGRRATWQRDVLNCALAAHLLHVDNPVHPSAFNSIINDRSEVMEIDYFKTNSSRQCCQFSRIDNVQYRCGASDCSNMCCRQLINSPIPSGIITLWCSNKYYNPQSPNKCDAWRTIIALGAIITKTLNERESKKDEENEGLKNEEQRRDSLYKIY